ncbi:MAG: hypothetical protein KJ597_07125 [Nanoarchaeota archaeon]|nr:hypothetical protein [Nanoarchaeota archaeon]MBU1623316.1 hypothetical protein [Nanoarchaeota archaeon]
MVDENEFDDIMKKILGLYIVLLLLFSLAISAISEEEVISVEVEEQTVAKPCNPENDWSNSVNLKLENGETKSVKDTRFDNRYNITVLEQDDNKAALKVNGEETGFLEKDDKIQIAGLDLIMYAPKSNGKVHFCISERPEAKTAYKLEELEEKLKDTEKELEKTKFKLSQTEKELEETKIEVTKNKNLLQRIVEFLKDKFWF